MGAGTVTRPDMADRPLRVTQTGPGQYEATFDVHDQGNYLVTLPYIDPEDQVEGQEPQWRMIRTGLSMPYSSEYREFGTNMDLLRRAAEDTGGRVLGLDPQDEETLASVFDRDLPPSVSRQPIWRWVVMWVLLPLFLLDVAGRRLASVVAMSIYVELAVFAFSCAVLHAAGATGFSSFLAALVFAEVVGWAIRYRYIVPTIQFFTSSVRALSRAGQRSAESLTQLKDVRDKVREDMESKRAEGTIELEPISEPGARFDIGDDAATKPAGDLIDEVGGATLMDESATEDAESEEGDRKPAGDLASRLKRAKRRARDQMRDQKDDND
jgi:hypothetical protein